MTVDYANPTDIVARTLYGEARGEGRSGMEAVAAVIRNRKNHPRWWGHDWISVCLDPWQFSSWNANDPNRAKLLTVTGADPVFTEALYIAEQFIENEPPDPTRGADSYYALGFPVPSWVRRAVQTVKIGHHSFWRVELPAPGTDDPQAPTHRYIAPSSADDLNAQELQQIEGNGAEPTQEPQ